MEIFINTDLGFGGEVLYINTNPMFASGSGGPGHPPHAPTEPPSPKPEPEPEPADDDQGEDEGEQE